MPIRNIEPTDDLDPVVETEEEERAKLEWLRAAGQEAIDEIDRGEGIEFETMDDLADYIHVLGKEAAAELEAELEAERKSG